MAGKASAILAEQLNTDVSIGNVRLGLFNRIVIDDVLILDQKADTLLSAARLSAKASIWRLLKGRFRFSNIQLYGYDIRLRKHTPEEPYNFQFIIDAFADEDTTSTPIRLSINSMMIRRGSISHDLDYEPNSFTFTPAHLRLEDVNLRISLDHYSEDSISLSASHLSFYDSNSGLTVKDLQGTFNSSPKHTTLSDVCLTLPKSNLCIPSLIFNGPISEWPSADASTQLTGELALSDLATFVPQLANCHQPLQFYADIHKHDDELQIQQLEVGAEGLTVNIVADCSLNFKDTTQTFPLDALHLDIKQFDAQTYFLQSLLSSFSQPLPSGEAPLLQPTLSETLTRLGNVQLTGQINELSSSDLLISELELQTSLGNAQLKGRLRNQNLFDVQLTTKSFLLAQLLDEKGDFPLNQLSLFGDFSGSIKQKQAEGTLSLENLKAFGTNINHCTADFVISPRMLTTTTSVEDDEYGLTLTANLQSTEDLDLDIRDLDYLQGTVTLDQLFVRREDKDYELQQLNIAMNNDDNGHHVLVRGDFIDAHADGRFSYYQLVPTVQQFLHKALPSLVPTSNQRISETDNQMSFTIHLWETPPLLELADIDFQLPEPGYIRGHIDGNHQSMLVLADFPHAIYQSEILRDAKIEIRQEADKLFSSATLQRIMDDVPVDLSLTAEGSNDILNAILSWDNHTAPVQQGKMSARASFYTDENMHLGADIAVLPGMMIISDTTWDVHQSRVLLHDKILDVHEFQVSQANRHLRVNGRISAQPEDTLYADLRDINLQYIFGLIDFDDVDFAGLATGKVRVHDFYEELAVDANLIVKDFSINDGLLGDLYVSGGFGRKDDEAIDLDGFIHEPVNGEVSHVSALIKPGHEPGRGMDLDVQARNLNAYFINDFTEGILTDLQGRASGHAHLYGPFRALNLEGNMVIDTLAFGISWLNTRYHLLGGDSVELFLGGMRFKNCHVYDSYHGRDNLSHEAVVNGELLFTHFKNPHYTFDISANDFLGYDFRSFGDQLFYGTVFASGNVHLSGQSDAMNIDIQCSPSPGTVFTYNASSPETKTDNAFITFVKESPNRYLDETDQDKPVTATTLIEEDESFDLRMNFDFDVTPEAQMRLLMDPRTEDYIVLYGNGHIRATYYNKGPFQMYGTYRIDHGTYKLTLQDVIHKEFRFQRDGTITFGGNPMQGDLNMQAIYTVPSVSLNDLASGSFSSSTVRVNCLMNIGGRAEQPQITFDFDIPNVNEDEKQMVRSLISTDEERNMQVLYLLGIGRFYSYAMDAGQSQTNAAMQSLLSSTLSGQLNELLSSMIGNGNWNFGTNLSTGNRGWNEMDVKGMLSGRLLNNRLLINGTFGYRDTPLANTNFIGDFDVQWLLTPSGNTSLKAYSETNDRYFTKTALTTQGIGLQVKRDFNNIGDFFHRNKK